MIYCKPSGGDAILFLEAAGLLYKSKTKVLSVLYSDKKRLGATTQLVSGCSTRYS